MKPQKPPFQDLDQKMLLKTSNQGKGRVAGFTMIELLAATMIFSMFLLPVAVIMYAGETSTNQSLSKDAAVSRVAEISDLLINDLPPVWFVDSNNASIDLQSNAARLGVQNFPSNLLTMDGKNLFPCQTHLRVVPNSPSAGRHRVTITMTWDSDGNSINDSQIVHTFLKE